MGKKIIFSIILLVVLAASGKSFSQSAVYFCSETGAYGYAHGYAYNETMKKAYDACLSYGGVKPVLVSSTESKGFGAIALGTDNNGNRVIGVALGFKSMNDAKNEALKQCQNYGGKDVYISESWNDN